MPSFTPAPMCTGIRAHLLSSSGLDAPLEAELVADLDAAAIGLDDLHLVDGEPTTLGEALLSSFGDWGSGRA